MKFMSPNGLSSLQQQAILQSGCFPVSQCSPFLLHADVRRNNPGHVIGITHTIRKRPCQYHITAAFGEYWHIPAHRIADIFQKARICSDICGKLFGKTAAQV